MATRIIKSTAIAWVTDPDRLYDIGRDGDIAISALQFSNREAMGKPPNPWIRVGMATITVELVDESQMLRNTVAALRTEQQSVRAEAEMRATEIDRQINELLAITNEVAL